MLSKHVAIVGATGAVGRELINVLAQLDFPVASLKLLASRRSVGTEILFKGEKLPVEELKYNSFRGVDIALFSAGGSIAKKFSNSVLDAGCILIDNSSAFRMEESVPLVIPEINPQDSLLHKGIIANPNCSTIIMLMSVFPIHQKYQVSRIVCSTYQAASGAGWEAMEELQKSTMAVLNNRSFDPQVMPYPYGFNLFSHNSLVGDLGYNEEELKMIYETKKILHDNSIQVTATCIRVPILRAHAESINIEFLDKAPEEIEVRNLLKKFPGISIIDDRKNNRFPMPIDATKKFDCYVGRIRKDISRSDKAIDLFVVGDQLLKGAALNAVQIAQLLIKQSN